MRALGAAAPQPALDAAAAVLTPLHAALHDLPAQRCGSGGLCTSSLQDAARGALDTAARIVSPDPQCLCTMAFISSMRPQSYYRRKPAALRTLGPQASWDLKAD